MINAFMKVAKTIESAYYQHMTNGSVINLINNFGNMYSKNRHYEDLMRIYNEKLNQLETTKS
tara:strand:+ start:1603 stop:1788 length:186 start_codon:yes stop_codon:yes gene_type:complete